MQMNDTIIHKSSFAIFINARIYTVYNDTIIYIDYLH